MRSRPAIGYIVIALVLMFAGTASAQQPSPEGPHITGIVGGSLFDGHVAHAEGITAGYRFNEIFAVEIGAEIVPGLRFAETVRLAPVELVTPTSRNNGRALLFLGNAVASLPVDLFGFRPYVLAGGGMANLRQSIRFAVPSVVHGIPIGRSQNVPALTVGGGLEYPVWRGLAVGLDVRYLHLFSERFETVLPNRYAVPERVDPLRFGTRIAYRF